MNVERLDQRPLNIPVHGRTISRALRIDQRQIGLIQSVFETLEQSLYLDTLIHHYNCKRIQFLGILPVNYFAM